MSHTISNLLNLDFLQLLQRYLYTYIFACDYACSLGLSCEEFADTVYTCKVVTVNVFDVSASS